MEHGLDAVKQLNIFGHLTEISGRSTLLWEVFVPSGVKSPRRTWRNRWQVIRIMMLLFFAATKP